MKKIVTLALLLGLSPVVVAQSGDESGLKAAVDAALAAEIRTDQEKERDRNRKPLKTLEFFGIEQDMKVLELFPGGGWYTKVLAPVLRDKGEFHVALGTGRVSERLVGKVDGFDKVNVLETEAKFDKGELPGTNSISAFKLGEKGFDAALTFRNMHNFDAPSRRVINEQVYKSLKKGGVYGVVDHTRRHMEPHTLENRRRADQARL